MTVPVVIRKDRAMPKVDPEVRILDREEIADLKYTKHKGKDSGVAFEAAEFNGEVYRRYPKSKHLNMRRYFGRGRTGQSLEYLHRAVWEYHHGPIPVNYDIHHKDGDTLNNMLDNLECLFYPSRAGGVRTKEASGSQNLHLREVRNRVREQRRSRGQVLLGHLCEPGDEGQA